MNKKHVAVLMGGLSPEREVSLWSGQAFCHSLQELGYQVTPVDVGYDIDQVLRRLKPDVALNALHGSYGEDGLIQGVLEYLQIPYTHSGVLASSLSMDKARAKAVVAEVGVNVAPSKRLNRFALQKGHPISPPYIVKPVHGGSSFGVVRVDVGADSPPAYIWSAEWPYEDEVLVERYIAGRELTCAVMGDVALGVCEIMTKADFVYDFDAKYMENAAKHVCPAKILPNIYQEVERMSLDAHRALGCRGISRSDFRYDEQGSGEIVWLELNSQPGMTKTSLVPDIAQAAGYSFTALVNWIVEDASCMR